MNEKEYIIYCDESERKGRYYSNFYGGLIVGASQYPRVTEQLNVLKQSLHLFNEVKWDKVSEHYLSKYQALMTCFFEEVAQGNVKVRIMFRQNAHQPRGLTPEQIDTSYFLLYYQFVKHAFGLKFIPSTPQGTGLRLYFDQFPDTREKAEQFRGFLFGLLKSKEFETANITISRDDITEVRSHDHVLIQCLDIVLGAMAFRLNDKHLEKPPGKKRRGKRTIAKEALHKTVLGLVRRISPNFNISVTTSGGGIPETRWLAPYMHWNFVSTVEE